MLIAAWMNHALALVETQAMLFCTFVRGEELHTPTNIRVGTAINMRKEKHGLSEEKNKIPESHK